MTARSELGRPSGPLHDTRSRRLGEAHASSEPPLANDVHEVVEAQLEHPFEAYAGASADRGL